MEFHDYKAFQAGLICALQISTFDTIINLPKSKFYKQRQNYDLLLKSIYHKPSERN